MTHPCAVTKCSYWEHCGGSDSCPPFQRFEPASPEQEKFLLFETRGAGFNNERMSLEIAYALAIGWGRTLVRGPPAIHTDSLHVSEPGTAVAEVAWWQVLPSHCGNPSNPRSFFKFEDIYDMDAMRQGVSSANVPARQLLRYRRS